MNEDIGYFAMLMNIFYTFIEIFDNIVIFFVMSIDLFEERDFELIMFYI